MIFVNTPGSYDPDNDPHKPKVGDSIPHPLGKGDVIGRVKVLTTREEIAFLQLRADEHDDPWDFIVGHPTRPFVQYLVWKA